MDQAYYENEQLQIQREIEQAIVKATHEPLTNDEARLLAWAAGVQFNEEKS